MLRFTLSLTCLLSLSQKNQEILLVLDSKVNLTSPSWQLGTGLSWRANFKMNSKNLHLRCLEKLCSALPQHTAISLPSVTARYKFQPSLQPLNQETRAASAFISWQHPGAWPNPSLLLLPSLQTVTRWSLTILPHSELLPGQGCDLVLNTVGTAVTFCRGARPHVSAVPAASLLVTF